MSLKLIYCRLLILQLVTCVCFTVYCICYIVHCPSICKVCDPASDWWLVIEFHVVYWSLAGSLAVLFRCTFCQLSWVTVQATGRLLLISIQMYWSLAWSPEQSQGFAGKVRYSFIKRPEQRLVACSIFNGSQGGRLSHCRRIIMYMYFSLWILVS